MNKLVYLSNYKLTLLTKEFTHVNCFCLTYTRATSGLIGKKLEGGG